MSHLSTIDKKVTNTQGGENIAYLRSAFLTAGNSSITLAKTSGLLHSKAGHMLKPALRPEQSFIPNERSLTAQRIQSVRSEVRGLPLPSQVSTEPPFLGTVSLFN